MSRQRLTCGFIKAVARSGRYGDGGRGSFGLSLLVKPARSGGLIKNWQQRYRKDGQYTSRGLGVYPDVSLEQARALAVHFAMNDRPVIVRLRHGATDEQMAERMTPRRHELVASTTLPAATARVAVKLEKHPTSFRRVFVEALEFRSRGFKAGSKTAKQARSQFETYIPRELADRPIEEVTPADLIECSQDVWHDKPAIAKKLIQSLNATFNHALALDLLDVSPLVKAQLGLGRMKQKVEHQRALPSAEVGAAIATIRDTDAWPATKLAFELLVLTACRSGEVRGATWDEVDLDLATWTVPGTRTKSGREHRVPLSGRAVEILAEAHALNGGKGLIFPSMRGKALSDNTISKLLRENDINAVPHGFRTSFRVWAAECTDVPREIAEHALGHIEGSASELAYRRTDYLRQRSTLMQQWADYVV